VTSANGGSQTLSGSFGVSIGLKEGENVTCTFSNSELPAPALSIDKVATESGFDSLDDVIHYTITATNTGNVTLHNVNVTDSQVSNLNCVPAVPVANLVVGASIVCCQPHDHPGGPGRGHLLQPGVRRRRRRRGGERLR